MAWIFDSTDYVSVADNAATTFPNGDWTIAGWLKLTTTSGWPADYFLVSAGLNSGIVGEFVLDIDQDSGSSTRFEVYIADSSYANEVDFSTTGNEFAGNTNWTHIAVIRSSTTITAYINGASSGSASTGGLGALNFNTPLIFGVYYNETGSGSAIPGSMAEWAKWDRALNASEIAALAKGYAPSFLRTSLQWYVPMLRDYVEVKAGIAVTNNGTTIADHPPIIYPSSPYIIQAPAAAGEEFEFAGSQTVSFDGSVSMVQSATFTDSQTVSFDGTAAMIQTATMTGAEEVSFNGTADTIRNQWAFDGSEDVSFDGTAALQQDAAFTGAETVSFDGSAALKQSAALTGSETVSFDGEAALDVAAIAFAGQGVLSFDGSIATLNLILEMEAAAAVSFDGEAAIGQQALFEGGATLSFDGVAALTGFQWDPVETPASTSWQDVD